jgi:hypothetical protein
LFLIWVAPSVITLHYYVSSKKIIINVFQFGFFRHYCQFDWRKEAYIANTHSEVN